MVSAAAILAELLGRGGLLIYRGEPVKMTGRIGSCII